MFDAFDSWRQKRSIRRTHKQLYALSDRMLADIGISRSDIASVGRNGHQFNDRFGR